MRPGQLEPIGAGFVETYLNHMLDAGFRIVVTGREISPGPQVRMME